jgi:hypothetical protein
LSNLSMTRSTTMTNRTGEMGPAGTKAATTICSRDSSATLGVMDMKVTEFPVVAVAVLPEVVMPGVMDMMATKIKVAPGTVQKMTLAEMDLVVTVAESVSSATLAEADSMAEGAGMGSVAIAASTGTALPERVVRRIVRSCGKTTAPRVQPEGRQFARPRVRTNGSSACGAAPGISRERITR